MERIRIFLPALALAVAACAAAPVSPSTSQPPLPSANGGFFGSGY